MKTDRDLRKNLPLTPTRKVNMVKMCNPLKITEFISTKELDIKSTNKMILNLFSIIVTCLIFVNVCYAQEKTFEGTIRVAASMDFAAMTGKLNKDLYGNTGDKLTNILRDQTFDQEYQGGLNEVFAGINGQFEIIVRIKENKIAFFNTTDGTVTMLDCDKGEMIIIYPFAKMALKQTIAEHNQGLSHLTHDLKIFPDSTKELGGYECKKATYSLKKGDLVLNFTEMWYTDQIILPKCYSETYHKPPGSSLVEDIDMMSNNHMYIIVTEIDTSEVSDENFLIPEDFEILTNDEDSKFRKLLKKGAKNKKTYNVGSKIPDVFWDY